MQALQEQEGGEEHGKQSRHRFKDTISADTIQEISAFGIRVALKLIIPSSPGYDLYQILTAARHVVLFSHTGLICTLNHKTNTYEFD